MSRLTNYAPLVLFCAMVSAALFGDLSHTWLKVLALFTLLWFVPIMVFKSARGHAVSWDVFAVVAAAGVAFAWSMGWLS